MAKASQKKQQIQKGIASQIEDSSHQGLLRQHLVILLLISLLAGLIYSNTLSSPYHLDDESNIVKNSQIRSLSNFLDFSGRRYVGFLSFALNYHLGKLNVFGYHLVNLLIHITNGFLVYMLVLLLLKTPRVLSPPSLYTAQDRTWIALSTALLFTAHPIQTQAVTYIVQRFTSLAALFYLLAVVCYLKGRLAESEKGSRYLWYGGALGSTLLAMKTKEISYTLPFMILLVESIFFQAFNWKRWATMFFFLLTLFIIPLSLSFTVGVTEDWLLPRENILIGRTDYLFTQFRVIVTYLRLLVLPIEQNLDYDYPIYHSLLDPPVFFSFLFFSALLGLAIYLLFYSQFRLVAFGMIWFFLTLSIESSIIPISDVIFEHRLYLPSVGFMLAASTVIVGLLHPRKVMMGILIGVAVTILSVTTYQRNIIWKDDVTLWEDVVKKSPHKPRAYNGLGSAYMDQERLEEAVEAFKTALTLKPGFVRARYNLGRVHIKQGRFQEAIQEFKTALILNPRYAHVYYDLANAYKELGRLEDADRAYKTALTLKPDLAEGYNNLGVVYYEQGRLSEASVAFEKAVQLKPDYEKAFYNLANVYKDLGRLEEAIQAYKNALTLNPDYADAHYNLGSAYIRLGRLEEAVQAYKATLTLKPDLAEAYNNLGAAYYQQGKLSEATVAFEKAVQLKPDYVRAHDNLGNVYLDLGRLKEAIQEYQIVLSQHPDLAETHYNLGNAYRRIGRIQEAIDEFQRALQLKPDFEKARQALKSLS